jgi:hypothetical protein
MLWAVVDEGVLRRPVGGSAVFGDQLESARLTEQSDEVAAFGLVFDMLRVVALPPEASIDLILQVQAEIR